MVAFGEKIKAVSKPEWEGKYVDYETLKEQLYTIVNQPQRLHPQGEYQFKKSVDLQLAVVNGFFKEQLRNLESSLHPDNCTPADPTPEAWCAAADLKAQEITDLEEYACLNYEAFRKALKKHDKLLEVHMMSAFMVDLDHNEDSFWKQSHRLRRCVDMVSDMYNKGERYAKLPAVLMEEAQAVGEMADFAEGGVKKAFVRKSTKYWVPRERFLELLVKLAARLPLYYFNEQYVDTRTTSVYLDNDNMEMYARRLRRDDGATLIRYRVYGDNRPSYDGSAFVERKTHFDKMYGGSSRKERFQIRENSVDVSMGGEAVALIDESAKDLQLQREIVEEIREKNLRPFTTTSYRRTVFQMNTDDRLRISIDSDLAFTKEYHIQPWEWHKQLGRIPAPDEYYEFPYVVLELKRRDVETPSWFQDMINSNLVTEVPKFSKFAQSCVTFRRTNVPELPYWVEENRTDFGFVFSEEDNSSEAKAVQKPHVAVVIDNNDNEAPKLSLADCCSSILRRRKGRSARSAVVPQRTGGGRPSKVDPKAFMANERTFLNWNQQAITLSTFGVALLSLSNNFSGQFCGAALVITGICVLTYGQYQFRKRYNLLRDKASGLLFLDSYGPLILTFCLVLTFLLAMIFQVAPIGSSASNN